MANSGKQGDSSLRGMLERINGTPVAFEDIALLMGEVALLDPEDRNFEGHACTAIRLFDDDENKSMSIMFRVQALARLIEADDLPGWTKPKKPDGSVMVHGALLAAAGCEPLVESGEKLVFKRETFLMRAFQLAKGLTH